MAKDLNKLCIEVAGVVRSMKLGRAKITLLDGSTVDITMRSNIKKPKSRSRKISELINASRLPVGSHSSQKSKS